MPPRKYAVSDSEEESASESTAPAIPSDEKLERGLRDTVVKIYKAGNMEELTVKRVRLATEKALGLEEGFFKADPRWKEKSDRIIRDEVVCPVFFYSISHDNYVTCNANWHDYSDFGPNVPPLCFTGSAGSSGRRKGTRVGGKGRRRTRGRRERLSAST